MTLKLLFFIGNLIVSRHFIELIIRLAYLKNNKSTHNLSKVLEKLIENNFS